VGRCDEELRALYEVTVKECNEEWHANDNMLHVQGVHEAQLAHMHHALADMAAGREINKIVKMPERRACRATEDITPPWRDYDLPPAPCL
jgi:hypothetical protein